MSIALESNSSSNRIEGSGFICGMSCIAARFESPESGRPVDGDRRFPVSNLAVTTMRKKDVVGEEERREEELLDSCSSSSIGRNSDLSGRSSDDDEGFGEAEVQSSYKGPLETMDALEDVLPVRRGISKFYCGKSKSFTSLADVTSSASIKDITKPENPYSRKRKNLLACSIFMDRNRNFPFKSNSGGISKRPTYSSRSTLALAVAMSSSESNNNNTSENSNSNSSSSPSPPRHLPPLHPRPKPSLDNAATTTTTSSSSSPQHSPRRNFSPWRSFSLTDLQCAAAGPMPATTSSMNKRDKL